MLDPTALVTGLTVAKMHEKLNELDDKEDVLDILKSISNLLTSMHSFLLHRPETKGDKPEYVTLYQSTSGPAYTFKENGRKHSRLLIATSGIIINAKLSGLGIYQFTPNPGWTTLDFPEGTDMYLDSSNTATQAVIYLLHTYDEVV